MILTIPLVSPPLSFYSRKPVVILDTPPRPAKNEDPESAGSQIPEDNLDRHVEDVLTRRDRFRRVMRGVWSFMKTRTCYHALSSSFPYHNMTQCTFSSDGCRYNRFDPYTLG